MAITTLPSEILLHVFSFNFTIYKNTKTKNWHQWKVIKQESRDLVYIAQACKLFKQIVEDIPVYKDIKKSLAPYFLDHNRGCLANAVKYGLPAVEYFCAKMQSNIERNKIFRVDDYLNQRNARGYTPVIEAILVSNREVVAYLLDQDASLSQVDLGLVYKDEDIEGFNHYSFPPLSWAIIKGDFPIIELIFNKCIANSKQGLATTAEGIVNSNDETWATIAPLHVAVIEDATEVIELFCSPLVKDIVDIDILVGMDYAGLENKYTTPLNIGIVMKKDRATIQPLIQAGAHTKFALSYARKNLARNREYYQQVIDLIESSQTDEKDPKKRRLSESSI